MVRLQKDRKAIAASGLQIIGVSYDSVAVLKEFAEKRMIMFPLLSDLKSKTIETYGLRNKSTKRGSRTDGIPYPATILVDQKGIIRANLPGTTFKRHSTKDLLNAAKKLKK